MDHVLEVLKTLCNDDFIFTIHLCVSSIKYDFEEPRDMDSSWT